MADAARPDFATADELRRLLFARCEQAGGLRAFCRTTGAPLSVVSEIRGGTRGMEPSVANALGYAAVQHYRRIR